MKIFKQLIVASFVALLSLVPTVAAGGVALAITTGEANVQGSLQQGSCLSTDTDCSSDVDAQTTVNDTVALVINIFSWIVGVISVIMIIFGGFKYITSGGDAGNVTAAKNTILYAIVGLIIVALSQVIVQFVLGTVTDATA